MYNVHSNNKGAIEMKKVLFLFILFSLFGCAIGGFEIPTVVIPDVDLNPETDPETPTEESYVITFDYGEGVTALFECASGDKIIEPKLPERENYIFNGWYCNGIKWNFNNIPNKDMVLIAKWVKGIEVIFEKEAGETFASVMCAIGTNVHFPLVKPEKEGFEFKGWAIDGVIYNSYYLGESLVGDAKKIVFTAIFEEKEEEKPNDKGPNATVIKFCSWDFGDSNTDNNLKRLMVERFNEEHYDEIYIEIVVPQGDYNTFLSVMAAARNLPDVFMVNSVPDAIINRLAAEIMGLAKADSEWNMITPALIDAITYGGEYLYAIPTDQYYLGLFANKSLLNKYFFFDNLQNTLSAGKYSLDNLKKYVQICDLRHTANSVIGINDTYPLINWLPSVLDTTGNTGYFTFNKTTSKLDFNGESTINAFKEIINSFNPYSFSDILTTLDYENYLNYFGTLDAWDIFNNGQMAFYNGGTWELPQTNVFDIEFIGIPGGKIISTTNYLCISNQSNKTEAAYEVAKYFSFGLDGIKARFDIIDENPDLNLQINGLPVIDNDEIVEKWFDYVTLPGVEAIYNGVQNGEIQVLVEGNKTIPGYINARFNRNLGIVFPNVLGGKSLTIGEFINETCNGNISIDDYQQFMTDPIEDILNEEIINIHH